MVLPKQLRRGISNENTTLSPTQVASPMHRYELGEATPVTTLHQPHKLPKIPEVSGSSRATLSRKHSLNLVEPAGGPIDNQENAIPSGVWRLNNTVTSSVSEDSAKLNLVQSVSRLSDLRSLAPSALSLPLHEIPRRKSSVTALSPGFPNSQKASFQELRSESLYTTNLAYDAKGHANSPVKNALERGAQSSDALHPSPSRTFIRTTTPFYLLDTEDSHNPRLQLSVRLPSPLFVGGGTVEGQIELKVDAASNKRTRLQPLFISRLSVDILGVEEVEDGRRWIFLSLATELFDSCHPPPSTLVVSQKPEKGSELFWQVRPATVKIPFCVHLPLKLGPPPYSSRQASIRYLLCPSAVIKIGQKRSAVRQAWTIQMLTIHDPEKALANLPSPLLATDTLILAHSPVVTSVKLTAGLHRQTWVSGGVLFTDVHVVNSTDKTLKRLEVQLEKCILWFPHSAASTAEKCRNNLRLPAKIDTEVVSKTTIKRSKGWEGIRAQAAETRTCELEIPKGHVTIGNGRYFEVRYFVKVVVVVGRSKLVSVQLPVTIIHIYSLDVMPNSLEQVATSIEAKRSMATSSKAMIASHQPYAQGRAFTAACQQSLSHTKPTPEAMIAAALRSLTQDVDKSSRWAETQDSNPLDPNPTVKSDLRDKGIRSGLPSCCRHLTSRPSCYHCHLLHTEHATKLSPRPGPKLPRLQVSTSGLGFSESEFEMPPDSPRKVMLSERERQMMNQERELKLQRQWSQQKARSSVNARKSSAGAGFMKWKNVAVPPDTRKRSSDTRSNQQWRPARRPSHRHSTGVRIHRKPLPPSGRSRSRTNPEHMRASFSDSGPIRDSKSRPSRGFRSMDRGDRYPWSDQNLVEDDVFSPRKVSSESRSGVDRSRSTDRHQA